MLTVCPKCTLTLAVTAADLRAGQGYVRCGRCANVFNALLGLSDDSELSRTDSARPGEPKATDRDKASATVSRPMLTEPEPEPRPPAAPALRLVDSPPRPLPPLPPADTPDDEWKVEEFRSTGTFETIVLEGDTFLQTEEMIPQEVLDSEIADVSRRVAEAHDAAAVAADGEETIHFVLRPAPAGELAPELAALREATSEVRQAAIQEPATEELEALRNGPRTRPGWVPLTGAVLLVLVLTVQALNHWRNDLATHSAWYAPLSRVAAQLGEPLHPNWDLNAYDLRQLGVVADETDGHGLRVRLSLANRGTHAQALPLLRLTLLDRYGKALSSGELQPAQYLPIGLRDRLFIGREQRIDTEVRVRDPSQQASSFELDVCVAAAGGGLRCAGDTPLVAGQS